MDIRNIILAVLFGIATISGVVVAFGGMVHMGARSSKGIIGDAMKMIPFGLIIAELVVGLVLVAVGVVGLVYVV